MMIRDEMFRRLTNWRRVYGDNAAPAVSITEIACRYAREMMTRKTETPEEQAAREAEELRYREEPSPAKNYRDANILASVWSSMPPTVSGIGVKEIIKAITFGSRTQLNRLRRQYGPRSFSNAIESSLTIFFRMVEDYERSISRPPANDDRFADS